MAAVSPSGVRMSGMPLADPRPLATALSEVEIGLHGALSALRLRGMDLSGHDGGCSSAAKELAALLGRVPLLLVDLKNCHITDGVAKTLAAALPSCPCLISFQASRTDDRCNTAGQCRCGITAKGAQTLCASLSALPTLQELDLRRHDLWLW